MKPIPQCNIAGCGLRVGYEIDGGQSICWLHAEQLKLPAHQEWRKQFAAFTRTFEADFGKAATKRDNYGILGR